MNSWVSDLVNYLGIIFSGVLGRLAAVLGILDVIKFAARGSPREGRVLWLLKRIPFGPLALACFFIATFDAWRTNLPIANSGLTPEQYTLLAELAAKKIPRRLSDRQRHQLLSSLPKGLPEVHSVRVASTAGSHEALDYAKDFESLFKEIGWDVERYEFGGLDAASLSVWGGPNVDHIADLLREAGVTVDVTDSSGGGDGSGFSLNISAR